MSINKVYTQVRDYRKELERTNAFTNGRMGLAATEFYKYLRILTELIIIPGKINDGFLRFLAKPDNVESLGPIINLIKPETDRNEVRYRIAVALTAETDHLVEKEKKYNKLGLHDQETLISLRTLEKYIETYDTSK